jgi:hypothetical protein
LKTRPFSHWLDFAQEKGAKKFVKWCNVQLWI